MSESGLLEVARALYPFTATVAKTLSFREHEQFLIYHPSTKEKNWWQVVNSRAQVGYVPSNYVTAVEISPELMGQFLDDLIDKVRKGTGNLTPDKEDLLKRLVKRRKRLDAGDLAGDAHTLSRTPSIVSIPPAPNHPHSQSEQPPPVPSHGVQYAPPVPSHGIQSAPPVPSHGRPKSAPAGSSTLERAPPVPSHSQGPATPYKKPVTSDKTMSVKRRVAQLSEQIGEPIQSSTGTLRRSNSSSAATKTTIVQSSPSPRKDPTPEPQPAPKTEVESRRGSVLLSRRVTAETVYQLVEQVRCHTDLSHELSRVAVGVVLSSMDSYIPDHPVITSMLNLLQEPLSASQPLLESTHDAQRLRVIFTELTSCKNDAQQRSWMLHEDELVIIDYIKELTAILTNADSTICRHVISSSQYGGVTALIQYYQMETRWSIRQLLAGALRALCDLDTAVTSILVTSVLPCELARDMIDHPRHIPRLRTSALLLTDICSSGEPMPVTHFDQVGIDFVSFVLRLIEDSPDEDEEIPDLFVNLILSYNLQFSSGKDNVVTEALAHQPTAKVFTEKILLLLNREGDPVRSSTSQGGASVHSVLKLFIDIFSCNRTSSLFYTNDLKVLIDIIVRQLADLSPGELRRHEYLLLCRVVMRNPGYAEHHHRRDDLLKCFTRIFCEENDASKEDQRLVREISNEFPHYFKA